MIVGMNRSSQVSSSCVRLQRRPPSTPPIPLRSLQLVAKQPQTPVELRRRRTPRDHSLGVRESWPGAMVTLSHSPLTPPSKSQPITELNLRPTNRPDLDVIPLAPPPLHSAASHPHPNRAPPTGRGSDTTMMSLLLSCHR